MTFSLLTADNLSCVREERLLFSELSLTVDSGALLQLEGPNGVGKTSLLKILAGLGQPETGTVRYLGEPINRVRDAFHADLLYLGHQCGVNPVLSPLENLRFYASVMPAKTVDFFELLDTVGLFGFEEQPAGQLSAGQQRRVALARLWLSPARLWILDEPFTAIDKKGVSALEARFEQHCQQGGAILLTTHQDLGARLSGRITLEAPPW